VQRLADPSPSDRNRQDNLLFERYLVQGDRRAREELVERFMPLARQLARRYHRAEEPFDDLLQVAFTGLLKALKRYDTERPTPFLAYAVPTITGELRRHYRDTGWAAHVNRAAQEGAQRVIALDGRGARPLTTRETAATLGMTVEAVVEARLAARALRADSLDVPVGRGEDRRSLLDTLDGGHDEGYAAAEDRATVERLTAGLSDRDRTIVRLRYHDGLSQAEIGRRVGVSQMQVSRLLRRIIGDLRATVPEAT
jgi:RNA polymerase sigma-B factor